MAKIDSLGERGKGRQERGDGLTKLRIEIGEDYDGWLVGWLVVWVIRPYAMCSVYIITNSSIPLAQKGFVYRTFDREI